MARSVATVVGWAWLALCVTSHGGEFLDGETTGLDPAACESESLTDSCDGCGDSCGSLCDSCCDVPECCDCFNGRQRILGLLPSDHCFDRFISPLSNPFFFEDPRSLTEVRGIFIDNGLPRVPVGGGDVQVWAGQVRARLTDRWSFIAPRLAYMKINNGGPTTQEGFPSAPVGVKYNLLRDVDNQFLLSGGMTYFIPGSQSVFSGFGDGDFHFFLTGGKEIFGRGHWLSGTGFRIPSDSHGGTQLWYWSNQWDYELPGHLYPLMGVNWFHWMRSATVGRGGGSNVTGLDLVNVPAGSVAGSDVVTCLVGGKWKPSGNMEVGSGFEFPLTDRRDILRNRVYADIIFRY